MNSTKKVKLFSRIKNDEQENTNTEKPSAIERGLSRKLEFFIGFTEQPSDIYLFFFIEHQLRFQILSSVVHELTPGSLVACLLCGKLTLNESNDFNTFGRLALPCKTRSRPSVERK